MAKKVSKPNPLKVFNDNKDAAYKKANQAMSTFNKSLRKADEGGPQTKKPTPAPAPTTSTTPFKEYLKTNVGAVPSDTTVTSTYYKNPGGLAAARKAAASNPDKPRYEDLPTFPPAKNPKNQKALDEARDKTYGPPIVRENYQQPHYSETTEQYLRRMGPMKKKGGQVKKKK